MPNIVRIENGCLAVDVSTLGAEAQAISTRDGAQWLWNGDAAFWTGRSPVLFPIVGRAPDDTLLIDGKPHPMAQHGFARRSDFTLATATGTMCRHELAASDAMRAAYPFEFLLAIEHRLEGHALTVSAEVANRGAADMPFGIGFHPAFVWPLPRAAGRPHTVRLDNEGEPARRPLRQGLLAPETEPSPFLEGRLLLDPGLFVADALIFPEGAGHGLTYAAEGGPALHFRFENLPNLALWTKPGAPFLCVEPWHGMAAEEGGPRELRDRPFTTMLSPGASARFAFTVTFPTSGETP
ncbi:aldose 1-epimerase family protein [Shinella pollutisoli]|uniref:Aldose 1-epimerase family protein n=1 Tax=Shinella pollutisoli TaxID=2250594 RepID=A0ABV7DLE7_9HYPH|nr:aldose 1-epimerase family protein [Shinella pollutisoli]